ncbi:MAG TPA: sigma-70 family RNA polymerase sigma factor [bacterium]|nr:sigma-70 family RNA polymerase sigma factor [bacterium]
MTIEAAVNQNEMQLIERAREGSDDAFDALVEQHMDRVYAVALRIVRQPADAEDVTQEVFITVFQKLDTFRGDANFSTWLYRITVNKALRHIKKRGRWSPATQPELMEQTPDPAPSQEDRLVEAQKREQLHQMMEILPDKQRLVLSLRVEQSLPFKEIARILGRSIGGVKANYFHAVRKIQAAVNGER